MGSGSNNSSPSQSSNTHKRAKLYKVSMCEKWSRGTCRYGNDCTFAHGDEELAYWRATMSKPRPPATPQAVDAGASSLSAPLAVRKPQSPDSVHLIMRPSQIRFCQDTVNPKFKDGRMILDTLKDLIEGNRIIRDMPMMQVVLHDKEGRTEKGGNFFSISNRRLCLYRLCEFLCLIDEVKVELLSELPRGFKQKFTTFNSGEWVRVRHDGRICGRTLEETTFCK